jgi:hypothetical protein
MVLYAGRQGWGLRCRCVGNRYRSVLATKNALFKSGLTQNFHWNFCHWGSRFWEFWANSLKSRLQFNHVPVHETHSAMVRKITRTSKTTSLNRIVFAGQNMGLRCRPQRVPRLVRHDCTRFWNNNLFQIFSLNLYVQVRGGRLGDEVVNQTVRSTSLFKLENRNPTTLVQKPKWTRLRGKMKMCTPVHGLSGFSAID